MYCVLDAYCGNEERDYKAETLTKQNEKLRITIDPRPDHSHSHLKQVFHSSPHTTNYVELCHGLVNDILIT